nr:sigma-70 family RNA polymerase sigma factor [Sphingomonas laterariae]
MAAMPAPGQDIGALYEAEAPRLGRFFRRRLGRADQVADMVQRVFVRLLGMDRGGRGTPDRPEAWLTTVAGNLVRDEAKSARSRAEATCVPLDEERAPAIDPHRALEARDMLRRVDEAIVTLPDRTREIFMAHRFDDLTYAQIADRLGISVKTVEAHMSRALQILHRAAGFPE